VQLTQVLETHFAAVAEVQLSLYMQPTQVPELQMVVFISCEQSVSTVQGPHALSAHFEAVIEVHSSFVAQSPQVPLEQ